MMKRVMLMGAPLALMLGACGQQAAAPEARNAAAAPAVDPVAAEQEVRAFIERYNAYYGANDLDNYFASFDPGLTQWWPSGRVDLKTYETDWRRGVAAGGGNTKVAVSDLRIQVGPSADAAVATYILEVTPRRDGKPVDRIERNQETDVLFKRDGAWKVVHVNYGPARQAKP